MLPRLLIVSSGYVRAFAVAICLLGFGPPLEAGVVTATATWDANTEPDIDGYILSYGTQSGQYSNSIDVGNVTTWQVILSTGQRYYFAVRAYNSSGLFSPFSQEAFFDPPNAPPILTNPGNRISAEGSPASLQLIAIDPDGTTLTYGATGLPGGLSINATTGLISGTLSYTSAGTHSVTATASDGTLSASQVFTWTVTHTNAPPTLTNPGSRTNVKGAAVSLQLIASDVDGTSLTYSATNLPGGLSVDSTTGLISGTPPHTSVGAHTVTATVSDGALSSSQSFTWTITSAALFQAASSTNNSAASTIAKAFATPNTAGSLIVAAVSWGNNSSVTCSDSRGNTYALATTQYDSTNNQSLAICFAPNVSAGSNTVTATFSSGPPDFRRLLIHEYAGIVSASPVDVVAKNVANGTTGTNAITSTPTVTTANGDLVFGAVMDSTGTTSITAGTGFTLRQSVNGTDMATEDALQVSAGSIAARYTFGASHRYLAQMVAFRVSGNNPPTLTNPGNRTDAENASISLPLAGSDPDGDTLTYSATNLPGGLSINSATGLISGTVSYSSAGTHSVILTVSDGTLSANQTISWTITNTNRAPLVTQPPAQTSAEGATATLAIVASDPDGDVPNFTATGLPPGLSIHATTGVISGTLPYTAAGPYSATVSVADGTLTTSTSFGWTITNTNRAPLVTQPPAQTSAEGATVTLAIVASDPDGDALSFTATGLPPGLSIHATTGVISGTLPHTTVGAPVVTVTVVDSAGLSAQTSFIWTVQRPQLLANGLPDTATLNVGGGALLTVVLIGGPAQVGDWVGLYPVGGALYQPIDWKYLNGTRTRPSTGLATATVSFTAPLTPGSYKIRFYHSDTLDLGATSATIVVSVPTLAVNGVAPPTTVNLSAGTPVSVALTDGPGHVGDWVGLYAVGDSPFHPIDWKYLNGTRNRPSSGLTTATLNFTAPFTSGSYQMRFYHGDSINLGPTSTTIVTSLPTLAVNGIAPPATVIVSYGAPLSVAFTGGPGNAGDWVGLYSVEGAAGQPIDWKYLNGTRSRPSSGVSSATVDFTAPAAPGSFQIRFYHSDTLTVGATSATIISPPTLTVNGVAPPATVNLSAGTVLSVVLNGGSGNVDDWVGLYPVGGAPGQPIDWKYLNGTRARPSSGLSTATVRFTAPFASGSYQIRFYPGDPLTLGATSATIVTSPPALAVNGVAPPATVIVTYGASLSVVLTGGPGNVGDWVGLYPIGGAPPQPIEWKYLNGTQSRPSSGLSTATLSFTAPLTLGSYQIRFYHSDTLELGTTSATIITSPLSP